MCGIVGAIAERNIVPVLVEGLHRLEYRGYDSAGVAVAKADHKLGLVRTTGKVAELEQKLALHPLSGRLAFIPWGTDESFDSRWHVAWIGGRLAIRCAQVESCLMAWGQDTLDMADMLEQQDLLGTLDEVAEAIQPWVAQDLRKPYTASQISTARAELRTFIAERKATILEQFGLTEE